MANKNPVKARLAKLAKRRAGDIDDLRQRAWAALGLAYELCSVSDEDARRKALLCFGQLAATYAKLIEVGEHEGRLQRLETMIEQFAARGQKGPLRRVI